MLKKSDSTPPAWLPPEPERNRLLDNPNLLTYLTLLWLAAVLLTGIGAVLSTVIDVAGGTP